MPPAAPLSRAATAWPTDLPVERLNAIRGSTPFLVVDAATIGRRVSALEEAIPGVEVFFALKCNPSPAVLQAVARTGASFEVASAPEMEMALAAGATAHQLLYSNPVKPPAHIAAASRAGIWRFAFDSEAELEKIARHAPGAAVYARLRVGDGGSLFPLSKKFGAPVEGAPALLTRAAALGLEPYGLTFHVGSQCTDPLAWQRAIESCGAVMSRLDRHGLRLRMINLGGGLPARYTTPVPDLRVISSVIRHALGRLPYQPEVLASEPGRYLVAESGVLAATVIGVDYRHGERWVFLDVGGYNGMMEAVQAGGRWLFPLRTSRRDHHTVGHAPATVTGPSCDSSDTMFYDIPLPLSLEVGDRLYIGGAGAYTTSYASSFNGFPAPTVQVVGGVPAVRRLTAVAAEAAPAVALAG